MFSDLRVRSQPQRLLRPVFLPAVLAAAGLSGPLLLTATPASAQQAGYGQTLGTTPMERQLYDGTSRPNSGSILDSTNPIDLMNKIRRGTAMDDATPPASAIDQALQQFEVQAAPAPAGAAPASAASAAAGGVSAAPSRPLAPPPMGTPAATPQSQSGSTTLRPAL